jgi:hypothetical protein
VPVISQLYEKLLSLPDYGMAGHHPVLIASIVVFIIDLIGNSIAF